ncbi:low molecular weight protein-tyrosine-phosphatase [Pseudoflavonifractor capillosus]|uniref:protein-tyrosine-phosphatase n=1 Tax=Pseudoflavonifractor capillosus TaxID=106588 RepID=A0A921MJ31_9FIRM|nr:low molecular weight protein-tyrosine-phosphatase [Pseudoflavonifractor capillosus]HJG85529.1 low molecular weight phosphotyrosine protein phosphatase [Pseudoflavonifractor capillosus]
MKKILFVCHGNICRSPMAEYVMKDLVKKAGLESQFQIVSAATSWEEIGNPVYPPARRKLAEHGISCGGHAARQLRSSDYKEYDLLIGMDKANLRNMYRICGGDFNDKMHLLLEYADRWKGPPREPSEAGRVGRGEARECSEFSPQAETEKSGLCFDEVADPWYTGDFDATWRDVLAGCQGLLQELVEQERHT